MGKEFDERSISGEKCGEQASVELAQMGKRQNTVNDTSCVIEEKKEGEEKNVVWWWRKRKNTAGTAATY